MHKPTGDKQFHLLFNCPVIESSIILCHLIQRIPNLQQFDSFLCVLFCTFFVTFSMYKTSVMRIDPKSQETAATAASRYMMLCAFDCASNCAQMVESHMIHISLQKNYKRNNAKKKF